MDYYKILGVNKNSSPEELKQAFRKLAMKHHPDKGGDEAEFKKINEAYAVLSDPQKKLEYDSPGSQQGWTGFNWSNQGPPTPGDPFDFEDIMRHAREAFNQNRKQARNPDAITDVYINLEQVFSGTDMLVDVGYSREVIYVNPGTRNGTKLRIKNKGPSRYRDVPPGDLIVRINVEIPDNMAIDGNNLYAKLDVNALEAIVGSTINFDHPCGKELKISIPKGTQSGTRLRLKGLGIPDTNTRTTGDFFVIVNIFIPDVSNVDHLESLNKIIENR
jgi:curved DNA-binding protein